MWDRKKYYEENKVAIRKKNRERMAKKYKKILNSWVGFIPIVARCEICGMKLYFNSTDKKKAIHFDHKCENLPIKIPPTHWLRKTERTEETEKMWEECDFGILCEACNMRIPTKDRINFIKKAYDYVMNS